VSLVLHKQLGGYLFAHVLGEEAHRSWRRELKRQLRGLLRLGLLELPLDVAHMVAPLLQELPRACAVVPEQCLCTKQLQLLRHPAGSLARHATAFFAVSRYPVYPFDFPALVLLALSHPALLLRLRAALLLPLLLLVLPATHGNLMLEQVNGSCHSLLCSQTL
jgi:hypothetical protein